MCIRDSFIRDRRSAADPGEDLLAMLLAVRDEETGEGLDDRTLRNELLTLFVAGHETTANALAWTFHLLAKHDDVRERLEAEVDSVLGGRAATLERRESVVPQKFDDEKPTFSDKIGWTGTFLKPMGVPSSWPKHRPF